MVLGDIVSDLVVITNTLDAIDIKRISEYTRKLADIGDSFNKMLAPTYARDFIIAYDISSTMLAKALQVEVQAKSALDEAEAIAFLDRAPEYFEARGEKKPTVEAKKAYVALDQDVKNAKDIHARAIATVSLLKSKVIEFREAISLVKTLQSDGYLSKWEGM
jgi:hypothetical protein